MGIGEQGGEVAKSAIAGLSNSPLCLALVLVFAMLGVYSYFKTSHEMENEKARYEMLIKKCWDNDDLPGR